MTATLRAALACSNPGCLCHRGRRTHCPRHHDEHPSLDAEERGGKVLIICRAGCRQDEVIEALRARGLWPGTAPRRPERRRSALDEARAQVLAEAKRQAWAREGVLEHYAAADAIRRRLRTADRARRVACALGPGERVWNLLQRAARLETDALAAEAAGDELMVALHELRRAGRLG